jgi:RimJ/RimL family protein N-acetyltransferase
MNCVLQKSPEWVWGIFDNFMQEELSLHLATDSDFPNVLAFVCHPSTVQAVNDTPESSEAALRNIWAEGFELSDMRHFVVESEQFETPVAYLRLLYPFEEPKCLWLSYFVVNPSLRGRGYGSRILQMLITAAKRTGCVKKFGVHTNSDNVRAIRIYERAGFKCIVREPWQYGDGTQGKRLTLCQVLPPKNIP